MKLRITASFLVLSLLAAPVWADDTPIKQPGRWAQDYTGRKADPGVVFGTLPNGLRYAIMHNETPSDGVAMRMRIGSGSIVERDEEQGLAHYLEHMAFRGSKNVADGEVVHMLERQGLRFGPDTNAFTSQDQTVYMFTFPKADSSAIDTGLTLFREIGERLTLAPAAVEAERGVVLSEERLRDTPPLQAIKANFGNALAGTRAVQRWPIGLVETIKGATSERLRRYYQANYRPDNATLIIVGNVDPAKIEAEIKSRFGDWKPAGKPDVVDPGTPSPARPASEFVAPGAQDSLSLTWVGPLDKRAQTEAVDREQLVQMVGLTVLNNRLADRASKPGSPFVFGQSATVNSLFGASSLTQIAIAGSPDKWREALDAAVQEQRQLLGQPIAAQDLSRAVTQLRVMFKNAADGASTRKSADIADGLVKSANDDELFTSPAQDLALVEPIFASLTPQEVSKGLVTAFSGKGPVLFRSAQEKPATVPALEAQLATSYSAALAERQADAAVKWPYLTFGKPSAIKSKKVDKALGATIVSFANGSRLIVKPTAFDKESITVSVALGAGRKGADEKLKRALWAVPFMPIGGTGKLDVVSIQRWAQSSGLVVSANLQAGTSAFTISGGTRPADLAAEMQLLAAYVRDPGFRPELGEKTKSVGQMMAGQIEANAGAVFARESQRVGAGGDTRFSSVPTASDIAATTDDDLSALLKPALAGPADVTIVGDVKLDDAITAVQNTFGAGDQAPRLKIPEPSVTLSTEEGGPVEARHAGRADQAFYGEFWPMPDYYTDPRASYAADVAAAVLGSRLVDLVREKLGLTYSPQVRALASIELKGQGSFAAVLETPAANFDTFHTLLAAQIAELAAKSVSPDELERAKRPLIESRNKDFETNGYWARGLQLILRDPRARTPVLEQANGIRAITAADVQAIFANRLKGKTSTRVIAKAK